MTTWTEATERPEYVVKGYVVPGYVEITYLDATEAAPGWTPATEDSPSWADQ